MMKLMGYLTIAATVSCSLVTAFSPLLLRPLVSSSSCCRRTKSNSQLHILISEEDEALEAAINRQVRKRHYFYKMKWKETHQLIHVYD
jgi:hypothetical protein